MQVIKQAIKQTVQELFQESVEVELGRPDEAFGDFATNIALQLSAKVGKNPREIAQAIVDALHDPVIAQATVAGPGFINLRVSDTALLELAQTERAQTNKQTVVIETNNPNPFKAMHIGHAFNAIIADTIANLIEASGAHTYRVSYHGDVGLHVGKSMFSLLKYVDGDMEKLQQIPETERNSFMSRMYTEGSKAYKEDETAHAEIEELTKQSFTRENQLYAQIYDVCKEWSFKQIDEIVAALGNKPIVERFLESDAELRGVKIVKDNTPKVFKESDGALVFEGSQYGSFDNVFVSARGTGLYGARDLGLIQLKNEQYHPDKSYIVTAEEQRDYFKGVLAAAGLCMPTIQNQTVNIPTGTVKLTTGKMSSRSGEVVEIAWLFEQVAAAIKDRGGEPTAEIIAGALRYEFLRVRVGADVVFDVQAAVGIQGNSGPYLQYAHARACSILSKKPDAVKTVTEVQGDERSLLLKISEYPEVLSRAIEELLPHHICNYLYELSQIFNRFYEHNRVIDDEREATRLGLVKMYASTLRGGLNLLGIVAPEKM